MAEVLKRGGIRNGFVAEVKAAEFAGVADVVEEFFAGFIAEVEPLGDEVHAQHAFESARWAAARFAYLEVVRLDDGAQGLPWNEAVHFGEKDGFAGAFAVFVECVG